MDFSDVVAAIIAIAAVGGSAYLMGFAEDWTRGRGPLFYTLVTLHSAPMPWCSRWAPVPDIRVSTDGVRFRHRNPRRLVSYHYLTASGRANVRMKLARL